jgi:hypothetical protein
MLNARPRCEPARAKRKSTMDLQSGTPSPLALVIASGIISLGGVLLGGLLAPLTQLFLERKRERRAAYRARLVVGAELLHAELILLSVYKRGAWPPFEELDAFLPTSAWRENRSSLAGMLDEDLFSQLVLAYGLLEQDRSRFAHANRMPSTPPIPVEVANGLKESASDLGRLRRQLGIGGGWRDEVEELMCRVEAIKQRLSAPSPAGPRSLVATLTKEIEEFSDKLRRLRRQLVARAGTGRTDEFEEFTRRLEAIEQQLPEPSPADQTR